jgi:hypothetical protein
MPQQCYCKHYYTAFYQPITIARSSTDDTRLTLESTRLRLHAFYTYESHALVKAES